MIQITPSQALLLLIQHYKHDTAKLSELKRYYLSGAKLEDSKQYMAFCDILLNEPLLDSYELVFDEHSINNDPTRRYFETHLAYETIKNQITRVKLDDVIHLGHLIKDLIDLDISEHKYITIMQVLAGQCYKPNFKTGLSREVGTLIQRIKEGSIFEKMSSEHREKIKYLVRVVYLSVLNTWQDTDLPLDIYFTHLSYTNRGKISPRKEQATTRTQHFGLLKGHMPLSLEDEARSSKVFSHWKSSEYSTFDIDSSVVQACFQHFVHPFSNSISGVFLAQLRVLARLKNDEQSSIFMQTSEFVKFVQLTLSIFLYYSGGHSLYEYFSVLALEEVQAEFKWMPEFSALDLESVFYTHNIEAFDAALEATLAYHAMLLSKQHLHQELRFRHVTQTFFRPSKPTTQLGSPSTVADPSMR